jgi:uncharacterized membrane protein YhhN
VATAFAVLCALSVAVLLVAERWESVALRRLAKTVASLSFLDVAISRHVDTAGPLDALLLCGLTLGAVGDVALLFQGQSAFLSGLAAFLLGHIAYAAACSRLVPVADWLDPGALPVLLLGVVAMRYLWQHLGKMRAPVAVYTAVVCVMLVGALATLHTGAAVSRRLAVGAALFAVSDLAVARDRFVADTFANKAWGLPLYYAGQICFAWACGEPEP